MVKSGIINMQFDYDNNLYLCYSFKFNPRMVLDTGPPFWSGCPVYGRLLQKLPISLLMVAE